MHRPDNYTCKQNLQKLKSVHQSGAMLCSAQTSVTSLPASCCEMCLPTTTLCFNSHLSGETRLANLPQFSSYTHFRREPLGISRTGFFVGHMTFLSPN